MKKIYLIGNTKNKAAFETFKQAELQLLTQGYLIRNLFRHFVPGTPDNEVKERLTLLIDCDTVFVLPDWNEHEYCLLELHTAIASNMKVIKATNTIIPERFTVYAK